MALPVTFTLTSTATQAAAPFAFGHVFAQGDVPAGQYVNSDLTDWQATPTTYWPDGSVRHAIIAGRINCTANVPVAVSISASGTDRSGTALTESDLTTRLAAIGTTTLVCGAETITLSSLVGTSALHRTVCSGPVMSNWLYRKQLSGSNHVVAWFDVRLYLGGAVEIFPWIENGYLTVASPTNDSRAYTFTLGGVSKFSQTLDIKHHTRVPLMTGSTLSHWTVDPQITPKHDTDYMMASKMVPNYAFAPSEATLSDTSAYPTTYTPNWLGTTPPDMGSAGYSPHIGILPNWAAGYLASGGDARAYKATIVNGMAAGSWRTHYRDETTNEPLTFAAYPNISIEWSGSPTVPNGTGGVNQTGGVDGAPDRSHQPSLAFMPWLLTGRWFFLDEILLWVTWNYMQMDYVTREGAKCIFFDGEVRARGWSIRSHSQALAIVPTTHSSYASLKSAWEYNVDAFEARHITGTRDSGTWVNNLGWLGLYSSGGTSLYFSGSTGGYWWDSNWQQVMFALAYATAWDMDIPQSTASKASHLAVRNFSYRVPVGMAGDGSADTYSYRRFAAFQMPIGTDDVQPPNTWMADWGDVYAVQQSNGLNGVSAFDTLPAGTDIYYGNTPVSSDMWSWHSAIAFCLVGLAYAAEHDATGADAAYARVIGSSNYSTSDYVNKSLWAITPREAVTTVTGIVGNATAAGSTASITTANYALDVSYNVDSGATLYAGRFAPGVTISGIVGDAVASGSTATVLNGLTVSATTGNAVAAGSIASVSDGSEPTWLDGVSVNQVVEISGSAPSVLGKTTYSGSNNGNWIEPWCGLSQDTRTSKVYSFANGGHDDYWGNEVNVLDLTQDAPAWANLLPVSAVSTSLPSGSNTPYYSDGRPASVHSYYHQQFIEARNRAVIFKSGAIARSGNGHLDCYSYNITTNTCDADGTYIPDALTGSSAETPAVCKISDLRTGVEAGTEDVYLFYDNNAVHKWTQATNTMTNLSLPAFPPNFISGYAAACYDPVNERILLWGSQAWYFKLSDYSFTQVTPTGSAAADALANTVGLVYEPVLAKFIVKTGYTASGTVKTKFYTVHPTTFAVEEMSVTGNSTMPAPATVSGGIHNVFNKFLYVPALKGVIYVPNYSNNAWFLRTHS